jgi:hypothetical protein
MNSGRSTEDESFATDVVDHRLFFEFIDLPTQPAHMHVHKIASRNELVIPNFLKQHCARQQLILPAHHVFEQAKFTRQEVDRALTPFGGTRQQIELERTDAQQGIAVLRRPPQQGFQPRDRLPTRSLKIKFSFLNVNLMVATALPPMCRWTVSVN